MAEHETAIVVEAPLEELSDQWTQFEEFPSRKFIRKGSTHGKKAEGAENRREP
jgi:hypothetical protein